MSVALRAFEVINFGKNVNLCEILYVIDSNRLMLNVLMQVIISHLIFPGCHVFRITKVEIDYNLSNTSYLIYRTIINDLS